MFNFNNTLYIFILLIPVVSLVLLIVNILFSETNSYSDKTGPFECGLSSFTQTRIAFTVSFILIAILFLPFDLEISSILPYVVSAYNNGLYGLTILVLFLLSLVIAFVYEINLGALKLDRRFTPIVKPLINKLYL